MGAGGCCLHHRGFCGTRGKCRALGGEKRLVSQQELSDKAVFIASFNYKKNREIKKNNNNDLLINLPDL